MIDALLWDVDGTLAETERDGHRVAFNTAFEAEGLPWHWSVARYGELLEITGGRERLLHDMASQADAPQGSVEREQLARRLHERKNAIYAQLLHDQGIAFREGVRDLMDEAVAHGARLAIVTTTSRSNVDALLRVHFGVAWSSRFASVVCGEDVAAKKPAPDAFVLALEQLALAPERCVAIEDSPNGVIAARRAGVPVVVTRSIYFEHASFEGQDVLAVGPGLHQRDGWVPACAPATTPHVHWRDLVHWHASMHWRAA